jgi:hypothetical protein
VCGDEAVLCICRYNGSRRRGSRKIERAECYPDGTPASNRYIAQCIKNGLISAPDKKEGYTIKVCQSIFCPGKQMMVLAGADANGVLYAVRDFEHYYADPTHYFGYRWFHKPFRPMYERMPEFETSSAPAIEYRGIWGWGTHIRDYKAFSITSADGK